MVIYTAPIIHQPLPNVSRHAHLSSTTRRFPSGGGAGCATQASLARLPICLPPSSLPSTTNSSFVAFFLILLYQMHPPPLLLRAALNVSWDKKRNIMKYIEISFSGSKFKYSRQGETAQSCVGVYGKTALYLGEDGEQNAKGI